MKRVRRPGLIRTIPVLCHYHDPYHIMMTLCIIMFMPVIVCIKFEEKMIAGVRFGTMIRRIIITLILLELLELLVVLVLVMVWTSHHNKHRHNNSKYHHHSSSSSSNKFRMIVGTARYRRTEGWVWRMCDATTNPAAATDANTTNYCRWWIFTLMVRNC